MLTTRCLTLTRLVKSVSCRLSSQNAGTMFKAADLQVQLTDNPAPKPDPNSLVFGKTFSDHMLMIEWNKDRGWGVPKVEPVRPLQIHPGAKVLHYSIELFEGMKAYRGVDNKIRLFRPEKNMERMSWSADRSCLPEFDKKEMLECIRKYVSVEQEWVPYSTSSTLYLRPTFIGHEPSLGVTKSADALLYVLACPVGPYFPTGMKPVKLLADPQFVRAWPGGAGFAKMGSNYGPTIKIQLEAEKRDCQQVLWLYEKEHYITEVGTMNLFMLLVNEQGETELVTPPLDDGVILPGVTRDSLLALARQWGEFKVSERRITMAELEAALNDNRLLEVFGAGTACVVCPVSHILYENRDLHIPTMTQGAPVTMRFFKELADIHYGRTPSDWVVEVD